MILCFEVEDSGSGIDPSKWESIFESFEQADPSTTRLHGGTGLGLCIIRTLVMEYMVNRPLYKAKMIQIMESAIRDLELQRKMNTMRSTVVEGEMHECLEMDHIHSDAESSNNSSDKSEMGSYNAFHSGKKKEDHFSKSCLS